MTTESQPYVFKVGETYKTRRGGAARVVCVDVKGNFPIVALHKVLDHEMVAHHLSNGRWGASLENKLDLLPSEPSKSVKVRLWCAIYAGKGYLVARANEEPTRSYHPNASHYCLVPIEIPPDIAAQCDWLRDA